ncbi:MAG: hypothetical protein GY781_21520 [Gammaproteobacteria bacterium]|nr:hypothetical protein [Gammaproteobacteria bacterium]
MKKVIPFDLDGSPVYIEVEDVDESAIGKRRLSRKSKDGSEEAENRFAVAISKIKPAAEAVLKTFHEMNTPEEIGLEFGIKFNARAGVAIFASVDSEATFKVSLKWKNKPKG